MPAENNIQTAGTFFETTNNTKPDKMRNKLTILFLFFLITYEAISQQYIPKSRTFGITAKVIDSPLSVEFTWDANLPVADGIKIRKKLKGEKKWGSYIIIDKSATSYTDKSVVQGKVYEYEIIRDIPDELDDAFQYLAVAINTPIVDYRGKILLLIESSVASAIKAKTDRLALDMICDGWQVIKKEFSRSTSVPVVKAWIKSEYNKDTSNVKSVFLLGNVPIPFSSSYAPDGHVLKAYPAAGYYGDMDGIWSASSVNYVSQVKPIYSNIPGDG